MPKPDRKQAYIMLREDEDAMKFVNLINYTRTLLR